MSTLACHPDSWERGQGTWVHILQNGYDDNDVHLPLWGAAVLGYLICRCDDVASTVLGVERVSLLCDIYFSLASLTSMHLIRHVTTKYI